MAQWRIELTTQDLVALSDGREVVVTALDEEQELDEGSRRLAMLEVTVAAAPY